MVTDEIIQTSIKRKKNIGEIYFELTSRISQGEGKIKKKGHYTQKELANKLGIADRTLRSYNKYFRGEKLGRYDKIPSKKIVTKLKRIAVGKRIKILKNVTPRFIKRATPTKTILSKSLREKLKKAIEKTGTNYRGVVCRIGIRYYIRESGSIEQYVSFATKQHNVNKIVKECADYINITVTKASVLWYEIFEINFQVNDKTKIPTND